MKGGPALRVSRLEGFPPPLAPRLFTLENGSLRVDLSDYGATILAIWLRDGSGDWTDILLGPPAPSGHAVRSPRPYFGATIGRFANRIRGARFSLGGKDYALEANDGANHLHGGSDGFDARQWDMAEAATVAEDVVVAMSLDSPAGDQGYPGRVRLRVEFRLGPSGELRIGYRASSDAPTPLNVTSHGYFNLKGAGSILGHELYLRAAGYLPAGGGSMNRGQTARVDGGPWDFRFAKPLGRDIDEAGGYDHCFVLDAGTGPAARVREPETGRWMELYTDLPGLQLYTGEHLDGIPGKGGITYRKREGFCLEPEFFPDSPNQPSFPSCILEPGTQYSRYISFRFGGA